MAKRKRDNKGKFIKQTDSIVSNDIFIPNHSGTHDAGTTGTPTEDRHLANKKYVDDKEVESFPTSLTAGSIPFSDGLTLAQDNSKLFWDNVNKRLGIGTTPSYPLHLYKGASGATAIAGLDTFTIEDDTNAGFTILTPNNMFSRMAFGSPADGFGARHEWKYTDLVFRMGTATEGGQTSIEYGNKQEGIRIDNLGRVGIGTTSPKRILEIRDTAVQINYRSDNGESTIINLGDEADDNIGRLEYDNGTNSMSFRTNTNDALTIDSSGNVEVEIGNLKVAKKISSATATFSTEGPTDNVDVSGVNTLFVDTSSNDVTIGGFAGGVAGQYLHVVHHKIGNDCKLEHLEGGGSQDLYLHDASDETLDSYGGWTLVCDGSDWYDVSHAKHV